MERVWMVLLYWVALAGLDPARAQPLGPVVRIPIEKVREHYYHPAENGNGKSCGVRLYGEWAAYRNYTNRSSYRIFTPGLQRIPSPQNTVGPGERFRFYCFFNGISTPFNDSVCPDKIGEDLPEWYVEVQRRGPSAQFSFRTLPPEPGTFEFRSTSTDPEEESLIEHWDFGDGSNGGGVNPIHRFKNPGPFLVSLTVTDTDALTNRLQRTVSVPAPKPAVSIRLFNKHTRNRVELGEEFRVRVTVEAGAEGVGALSGLAFTGVPLVIPEIFSVVRAPAVLDIGTLPPGETKVFDWTLRAELAGEFALVASGVTGRDAIQRPVSGAPAAARGEVTSLILGIVQRPAKLVLGGDNNQDGETNALDRRVELIVGITNVSQQDVTGVRALIAEDPIQLTSLAEDLNIWLTPVEVPPGEFGTIRPGAANAVLRTNVYEATDRTYAEASIVVQGKVGDAGVQARGEGLVDVGGETLIEARFAVEDRDYRAGQVVRVFGRIKNVSRFKNSRGEVIDEGRKVGVVIHPTTEGNGIGGFPFLKETGGRTPDGPTAFLLEPDQEIEIAAIVPTAEVPTNSIVSITYQVAGFVHGDGDQPRRARPGEIEVVERVTEGWSARHDVELAGVVETTDPWLTCPTDLSFGGFVSCRFTEGLGNAGGSLVGLALLTGTGVKEIALGSVRMVGWGLWTLEQTLDGLKDPAARARLATEVAIDLEALQQVGVESLQGVQLAAAGIGPAIERAIIDTGRTLESGDLKRIAGGLARITGENIDMPLEALVAARAMRKAMLVREGAESAAKQALEQSFERQARELGGTVDDFAARGQLADLPTSDDLPTGVNVVNEPRVYRDAYGARTEDVDGTLRVAREEGVILTFRSRSPRSAALLDAGSHLPKPHGVSIKTVSEIDRKFLGYPEMFDGECVLVEPPFPWINQDKFPGEFWAAANNYMDRFPELKLGTDESAALRWEVYERLSFQFDEWPKQAKNFVKYSRDGIDVNFHAQKQNLGLGKFLLPNKEARRAARLEPHTFKDPYTGVDRQAYRLLMDDGAGHLKPITGDIDFLGIFNPDGSMPSLAKRIRVYRKMIALGMQHGESFTFYLKDLRNKFLRCCTPRASGGEGEKMLAATPFGELLTTQFRDSLSVIETGPNTALKVGKGEFAFLEGAMSEVNTLERTASDALPKAVRNDIAPLVTVSALARMAGELKAEASRNGGQAVRMGADGQPEIYDAVPSGDPPPNLRATSLRENTPLRRSILRTASEAAEDQLLSVLDHLEDAGWENVREPGAAGAAGGRWRPATPEEVRGGPAGGGLKLSPYTYFTNDVPAGTTVLPVLPSIEVGWPAGTSPFAVGDRVAINPGGPSEEFASITSVQPLTVSRPLQNVQEAGAMVLFLSGVPESARVPGALPAPENLLVWLRADAGLELDGTNLVSWTDQSRNGFVFRPSAVTTRPAWVGNSTSGIPAIRFNSSSTPRLHGDLGRTLTNATIFTLARFLNNATGDRYIYAFGTRDFSGMMMTLGREGRDDLFHFDGAAQRTAPGSVPGTDFRVYSQVFGDDGPDSHRLVVDSRTVLQSRTTVGRAYSAVATNVVLGKYVTGSFGFTGDLAEWIVYDRTLTASERFEVEEYLRNRAALSPAVPLGSRDLSQSDLVPLGVPPGSGTVWKFDAANREAIPDPLGGPSLLLTGPGVSNQVVRTQLRPGAGDGTLGVVFGWQDAGWFHLFDWRATANNDPVLGAVDAGMSLRTVHLPDGDSTTGGDLGGSPDPARATVWRSNDNPWIAGRTYDLVLHLGTTEFTLEVNHAGTNWVTWTIPDLAGATGRVGHYAAGASSARLGPMELPGTHPVITRLAPSPDGLWRLEWMDGDGPYVIEGRGRLDDAEWLPMGPATANQSVVLPWLEESALFRVRSTGIPNP